MQHGTWHRSVHCVITLIAFVIIPFLPRHVALLHLTLLHGESLIGSKYNVMPHITDQFHFLCLTLGSMHLNLKVN